MKMNVRSLMVGIWASVFVMILSSCNTDADNTPDDLERWNAEVAQIDADLIGQGNVIKDPASGIRIVVSELGTGLPAQPWSQVDVDYVGRRYLDKVTFDPGPSLTGGKLSGLIPGWQVALSILPAGSEGKLIIPSAYGYGPAGQGGIPGNTILEFDIKFKKVGVSASDAERLKSDTLAIDNYLTGKNIDAIKDSTGLRYVVTEDGFGPFPTWYDKIKYKASYKLLTNDASVVATIERAPTDGDYNRVIDQLTNGLKLGLQKIRVGSKATFYLPSGLAFGPQGASNSGQQIIPANANIIIEFELIELVP